MAIIYDPTAVLKKIGSRKKLKEVLKKTDLNLKKNSLKFASEFEFLDRNSVVESALKAVKSYQERLDAGLIKKGDILKDPKYLINQIQNNVLYQIKEKIRDTYAGEPYEWLPSDADDPRPEHQLLYGTIRVVGDGEMPGDEPGCKCGMRILVDEEKLNLK